MSRLKEQGVAEYDEGICKMSDEKYKQEARHSWQEIASIAESVPESASYIHGFIDGMKIGNKELEHKLEMAKEALGYYAQIDFQPNNDIAVEMLEKLK